MKVYLWFMLAYKNDSMTKMCRILQGITMTDYFLSNINYLKCPLMDSVNLNVISTQDYNILSNYSTCSLHIC